MSAIGSSFAVSSLTRSSAGPSKRLWPAVNDVGHSWRRVDVAFSAVYGCGKGSSARSPVHFFESSRSEVTCLHHTEVWRTPAAFVVTSDSPLEVCGQSKNGTDVSIDGAESIPGRVGLVDANDLSGISPRSLRHSERGWSRLSTVQRGARPYPGSRVRLRHI
jgi:hypothetical protein